MTELAPRSRRCPRDHDLLQAFARTTVGDRPSPPITADMCRRCHGVWYDASELAQVNPTLARVHGQPAEIFRDDPGAAADCPSCATPMRQFRLLNLALDYCLACRGVWVDGDEHAALAATRAAEPAPSDPYRRRAEAEAIFLGRAACVYCKVEVPLRESVMTADGVSCDACAVAHEDDAATPDPRLLTVDTGAWAFLRDIGSALGQVLLWTLEHRHCPRCGRPTGGCSH